MVEQRKVILRTFKVYLFKIISIEKKIGLLLHQPLVSREG